MDIKIRQTLEMAEKGNPTAQFDLGVMYYYGSGTELDTKKGVEWFQKAAKKGNPDAQIFLSAIYREH